MPSCKGLAAFVPLLLPGERQPANKIQLRRLAFRALRQLCCFFPLSGVKGLLRLGKARGVRRGLLRKSKRKRRISLPPRAPRGPSSFAQLAILFRIPAARCAKACRAPDR